MATLFRTGLPSPPVSASSPSGSVSLGDAILPAARSHPLQPGSRKENTLINYIDEKILWITRRYAKKFTTEQSENDDAPGYTNFEQVVQDLDAVFEVVWISGTPALQVPYLLSLAGMLCSYMQAFSFSTSLFPFVKRLDAAFTNMLRRLAVVEATTEDKSSYQISATERVRIRSLVEDTRVMAVEVAGRSGHRAEVQDLSDSEETERESEIENPNIGNPPSDDISIAISKIYKQTLEILGDSLI